MQINCPKCQRSFSTDRPLVGRRVKCHSCQHTWRISESDDSPDGLEVLDEPPPVPKYPPVVTPFDSAEAFAELQADENEQRIRKVNAILDKSQSPSSAEMLADADRVSRINASLAHRPSPLAYNYNQPQPNDGPNMGWAVFWTFVCFPVAIIYVVVKSVNKGQQ